MILSFEMTMAKPLLIYIFLPVSIAYAFYTVLLHPLSKYPGPMLAQFTEAYGGYWAAKRNGHVVIHENFKRYGPVFRQAPNRLVFRSAAALRDIYLNPNVMKGDAYLYATLTNAPRHVQLVVDRAIHKKKRKVVAPVVTELSMRNFEPTMLARVDELLLQLREASERSVAVNMTNRIRYFAYDVTANLGFGFSFNMQTDETYRYISELLMNVTSYYSLNQQWGFLRNINKILLLGRHRKQLLKYTGAIEKMVKARMAQGKDAFHDFFSLASDLNAGEQFFLSELWNEAGAFLAAGSMTTAYAISGIFFYLSRYPDCYRRLAKEIRTTFASSDEIKSGPQLSSCKYLRACLEEGLRCTSPFLTPAWRQQDHAHKGVFTVDGHVIPRGTQVAVPLYAIFHNEDIFEDPFVYRPERWLAEDEIAQHSDTKAMKDTMRKAFAPFLLGDRDCVGKAMAWAEMGLAIAHVIWHFDFERAPGEEGALGEKIHLIGGREVPEYIGHDIVVADHDGPNLIFRQRKEAFEELKKKLQ